MASEPVPADPGPPLGGVPSAALILALGMSIAAPQRPSGYGRVSTLIDELRDRGEWDAITAVLNPGLVDSIEALESADRGQRWARTGRR